MPERSRSRLLLASGAAALTLGLGLAGCSSSTDTATTPTTAATSTPTGDIGGDNGIADQDVQQILAAARTALSEAETVKVVGSGGSAGDTTELDLSLKRGEGATGTIGRNGQSFEVLAVGSKVYIKVTQAFLSANNVPDEAAKLFDGKWLELSGAQAQGFEGFTDTAKFAESILRPSGTVSKGERGEVGGVPAIALDSSNGGRLWISTVGQAVPLKIENSGAATASPTGATASPASSGELTFTYDQDVTITPPPSGQVVDLGALTGGGAGATTSPSP